MLFWGWGEGVYPGVLSPAEDVVLGMGRVYPGVLSPAEDVVLGMGRVYPGVLSPAEDVVLGMGGRGCTQGFCPLLKMLFWGWGEGVYPGVLSPAVQVQPTPLPVIFIRDG